jgi:hypothetical protein
VALELAGLVVANVGYFVVGAAAFVAAGWVTRETAGWPRLGAAYLFGMAIVVIPASYLALLSVPVGLSATCVGLVVLGLAVWRKGLPRRLPSVPLARPSLVAVVSAGIALVGVVVLAYALRTFATRPLVDNDAWAIWTLRARLLYQDAGAAAGALRSGTYGPAPYPIGLPTLNALGFGAMGRFDGTLIGMQFLFLLTGFGAALWSILHRRANPIAIAVVVVAIVVAPELVFQLLTQYADVPLGLFVGTGVAAGAAWIARPDDDAWLLACFVVFLAMAGLTKSEGMMFAVVGALSFLVVQLGPGWRARVRRVVPAVGTLALLLVPWFLYTSLYHLSTPDYDLANVASPGYLRAHSDRLHPVIRELYRQLHNTPDWGLLIFAIAVGVATAFVGLRFRLAAFGATWLLGSFAGLVAIYWVSTLPTTFNLTNSSFRTIVSLLVGGTSMLPLLVAPTSLAADRVEPLPGRALESG